MSFFLHCCKENVRNSLDDVHGQNVWFYSHSAFCRLLLFSHKVTWLIYKCNFSLSFCFVVFFFPPMLLEDEEIVHFSIQSPSKGTRTKEIICFKKYVLRGVTILLHTFSFICRKRKKKKKRKVSLDVKVCLPCVISFSWRVPIFLYSTVYYQCITSGSLCSLIFLLG